MAELVNFTIRCGLLAISMFCVMAVGRAFVHEVYNFDELQSAINNEKTEIAIKDAINFIADGPLINYNIAISGPSKDVTGLLNGGDNHKLLMFGGNAKDIALKNLHLSNGNNGQDFDGDGNGGGAIHLGEEIGIILENTTFSYNHAESNGGAIFSQGAKIKNGRNNNSLTFRKEAIFNNNSSSDGSGGAINANYSDLIFKGKTKFNDNKSSADGGAIALYSEGQNYGGSSLTFENTVTFYANESEADGGAINSRGRNTLIFLEGVTFLGNSTVKDGDGGGAIFADNSTLTFGKSVIFENNRSANGGAIYISGTASIKFNDGLRLIENTTREVESGALYISGLTDGVVIDIVHNDPAMPTEFRGNRSGGDYGRNAVYMARNSQLNFTVRRGNVNIFDVFSGNENESDNTIKISRGEGWINLEKDGSIENVTVVNEGNLKLAGKSDGFDLIDFENSGTIRFEILSGGGAKIKAKHITLGTGTILEIVAVRGQLYQAGESYDILAIDEEENSITINGCENINLKSLHRDLKIEGKLSDDKKIYRIVVKKTVEIGTNPEEIDLFSHLGTLDHSQWDVANLLSNIYFENYGDDRINNMLDRIGNLKNFEDQKTTLTQIYPQLLANIINVSLLDSVGQRYHRVTASGLG
ncbi:MAG: hypothetical protein LBB13_00660, partial [Rickettsiales bacterium]|nr:hypothetical protein [Rickettsiales bacterium]